ncbi:hypothetical protein DITRI_Ditri06bG0156200 [Diplodiscus trichospermus]
MKVTEFAGYVCESMVSLGSSNLPCIVLGSTTFSLYLLQSVEFRNTRQLVHSISIPLVKSCPSDMWESEAVTIVCSFSAAVVLLAIFTNNVDLRDLKRLIFCCHPSSMDIWLLVYIMLSISARPHCSVNTSENRIDEGETVGLAAIL